MRKQPKGGREGKAARVKKDKKSVPVKVTVSPMRHPREADGLGPVAFEEPRLPKAARAAEGAAPHSDVRHLEDELRIAREELSSTIQQLEQSNERLKASEEEAARARQEWERTFDSVPDLIALLDDHHRVLRANRAMARRLGVTPDQCVGAACYKVVHGTDRPPEFCPHARTLVDGKPHEADVHEPRLDGDFLVTTTPLFDAQGQMTGAVHVARDVSGHKRAEERLRRLNRTLKALGRSSQAMLRAEDETAYLEDVCRIIVEDCGHVMVWVGYAEDDAAKGVRPVAHSGFEEGYLETLDLTWAETDRGRGPTGAALRTGRPAFCRNMLTDPLFAPWREKARKRGYASSLALPLMSEGKAFGALSIYFREPDPFTPEEVSLLTELAEDLAHGVTALRTRAARDRAEKALRESKEHLELRVRERTAELTEALQTLRRTGAYTRSLIEASVDPLVTIGPDGTITDVNAATEAATGLARRELIGTDFSTYFTEPDKARGGYRRVFDEGSVRDYPLELRGCDGRTTPVLYNAAIYRDEGGQVVGVFAAARDITVRKRAEAQAQAERRRLYDVLETLPVYVVLLAADYHVPFANRFFRERFGESHGQRCYEYLFNRAEPCEICESYKVLQDGQRHHWYWTGPDGRDYDIHDFPFTDADGSGMILEMGIDITERKRAEEALQEAYATMERRVAERTAELARSNEDLSQFAHVASHDLQEPLRMVAGFLKLLEERYKPHLDEKAREYISYSVEGATRMSQLIADLLAYSRVGQRAEELRPADAGAALEAALANLQGSIREAGATVTHDDLPTVRADATQLMQLLQNLVGNAIKFRSPERPCRVHVGAERKEGRWVFCVRDNGIGIDPRQHERVFVLFQRLHTREKYSGTGIGLAICKKIVERHGGRIWVESKVGEGSDFRFTVPQEDIR